MRPTSRHHLPLAPELAAANLAAVNREIEEFDRVTGRTRSAA